MRLKDTLMSLKGINNMLDRVDFFSFRIKMGIIFLIILIPVVYLLLGVPPIGLNNANPIITLLIQIESALVAIIISFSLVTVQLAASAYSNRVIDTFKKRVASWSVFYISSIILGLLILILGRDNNWLTDISIFIEYYMSIIIFLSLIPFIFCNFSSLKPSKIIENLAVEVTEAKTIASINSDEIENPLQPIIDILQVSLSKHDHKTLEDGLNAIDNRINNILNEDLDDKKRKEINHFLIRHFKHVSNVAIKNKDDYALEKITTFILKNGVLRSEGTYDKDILVDAITFLKHVGNQAIDAKMSDALREITLSLVKIGEIAALNGNLDSVREIRFFIQKLFFSLINLDVSVNETTKQILKFEKKVYEKINDGTLSDEYSSMEGILILHGFYEFIDNLIDKKDDASAANLIGDCYDLMDYAIKINSIIEIKYSVSFLHELRKKAIQQELKISASFCGFYIAQIFLGGVIYGNEVAIDDAFETLLDISRNAENEEFITKKALIKAFERILKILATFNGKLTGSTAINDFQKEIEGQIKKLQKNLV